MKRILLYSPDVVGHPRVYCRVIADALADQPCELVVAMGFSDALPLAQCPDLLPLLSRPNVSVVDTRGASPSGERHLRAEDLRRLQRSRGVGTTLFIEADKSRREFERIAAGECPPLLGRNLGIFSNTAEWYPGEDSFTGEVKSWIAPTLRTTLGNLKRAILNRKQSPRYFFESVVLRRHVLDEILVKDERLADWRGDPVHWMPEISRPAATPETAKESDHFRVRQEELEAFLERNRGREPMLYFGDAAYYKGYDLFMKFVSDTPSTCAIHAGQTFDEQQRSYFAHDVDALRMSLKRDGRLHETNEYVHTQRLKELYFNAIRVYITTHRLALSSSTVIQALELGRPVLVPNRGLLGHRVREHGLGDVYEQGDLGDLARKASQLWNGDLDRLQRPLKAYWQRFSDESIQNFFVSRLLA